MELVVRGAASEEDVRLATELMATVHGLEEPQIRHWLTACSGHYPGYALEHTRVALWKGRIIGALRLTTDTIRIGEARLKMGGIGWASTDEGYRHMGVCRSLVEDAQHYMRMHGYHVSMLFGILDMYHRFGYVTALADHAITVDVSEARAFDVSCKVRAAKPGDIPAIQRMHEASDNDVACSLLRSAAHLQNKWVRWNAWYVLTDAQGKVVAYFYALPERSVLRVIEVGVAERGLCADVLGACANLAMQEDVERLRFEIPPPHVLARCLLQFRSVHEMHVQRGSGGMMAFVNIGEALESMVPEWEDLLARSGAGELRTELTFLVGGTPYRIRALRGAVDMAAMPGKNKVTITEGDLMHLLTGYRYAEDIVDYGRGVVSPDARVLCAILFPKRWPFVWRFDRF